MVTMPSQPSGGPGQYITPLVFSVPFPELELHALVYGDRTASGMAGGLAGEYTGSALLQEKVSQSSLQQHKYLFTPPSLSQLNTDLAQ